jgi:hypothetical protein
MVEALLVGGIAGIVLTALTVAISKSEELLRERAKALKEGMVVWYGCCCGIAGASIRI